MIDRQKALGRACIDSQTDDSPGKAKTAIAKLFDEHNDSLVQLLRARLHSVHEARDAAQEAYVRLLQLDRVGTISYLRSYLFRTALNIAIDRQRRAATRKNAYRDPEFDPAIDEFSPDRHALAADTLRCVEAAIMALPSKPRLAFLLHRYADLDIHEVSRRLGVSERMVRNYIIQALVKCRSAVADAAGMQSPKDPP